MVPRARHSQVPATSAPVQPRRWMQGHPYPQTPHTKLSPASGVWLPGAATIQSPSCWGAGHLGLQVEGEQGL